MDDVRIVEKMLVVSEKSRIAELINSRVEELKGVRTQREIAEVAGYRNQNMITMIKLGQAKVAIDKVASLAQAIEVDPGKLMLLALEQFYSPDVVKDLVRLLTEAVTRNEAEILDFIRQETQNADPKLNEKLRKAIRGAIAK